MGQALPVRAAGWGAEVGPQVSPPEPSPHCAQCLPAFSREDGGGALGYVLGEHQSQG